MRSVAILENIFHDIDIYAVNTSKSAFADWLVDMYRAEVVRDDLCSIGWYVRIDLTNSEYDDDDYLVLLPDEGGFHALVMRQTRAGTRPSVMRDDSGNLYTHIGYEVRDRRKEWWHPVYFEVATGKLLTYEEELYPLFPMNEVAYFIAAKDGRPLCD